MVKMINFIMYILPQLEKGNRDLLEKFGKI